MGGQLYEAPHDLKGGKMTVEALLSPVRGVSLGLGLSLALVTI